MKHCSVTLRGLSSPSHLFRHTFLVNSIECVGFVSEIVAARQFGLISWVEIDKETNLSVAKEKLFFHLNDSSNASSGNSKLRKGDEVKFLISNTKPKVTSGTGTKKIAVNIERLTPGTLPKLNIASLDRNLCQGKNHHLISLLHFYFNC
jgi:hypothetical protein